jgi:hypothetical protein
MKLLSLTGRAKALPLAMPPAVAAADSVAAAASAPSSPSTAAAAQSVRDEAPPRGCGWYDSSFELQQGLRVEEHLDAGTLASQLPLHAWLELQLSGWRGAVPGAPSCVFTPGH